MSEFSVVRGIDVPNLADIHESYEIKQRNESFVFAINVSADNIESLITQFCSELVEPCFLIIEVPTNETDERELRLENTAPFHCNVHYCDGLSKQILLELIKKYGELLVNDGMVCFGLASHISHDELYFGRYKITKIFSADEQRYKNLMGKIGIPLEENIKTVWDNFSRETPGSTRSISVDGKKIYDVLEELKEYGLYFAERR
jgi:hypothetical protein